MAPGTPVVWSTAATCSHYPQYFPSTGASRGRHSATQSTTMTQSTPPQAARHVTRQMMLSLPSVVPQSRDSQRSTATRPVLPSQSHVRTAGPTRKGGALRPRGRLPLGRQRRSASARTVQHGSRSPLKAAAPWTCLLEAGRLESGLEFCEMADLGRGMVARPGSRGCGWKSLRLLSLSRVVSARPARASAPKPGCWRAKCANSAADGDRRSSALAASGREALRRSIPLSPGSKTVGRAALGRDARWVTPRRWAQGHGSFAGSDAAVQRAESRRGRRTAVRTPSWASKNQSARSRAKDGLQKGVTQPLL